MGSAIVLFQDVSLVLGEAAVFWYLWKSYAMNRQQILDSLGDSSSYIYHLVNLYLNTISERDYSTEEDADLRGNTAQTVHLRVSRQPAEGSQAASRSLHFDLPRQKRIILEPGDSYSSDGDTGLSQAPTGIDLHRISLWGSILSTFMRSNSSHPNSKSESSQQNTTAVVDI